MCVFDCSRGGITYIGKVKCMHLLLAFTANAPLDSRLSLKEATAAR